MICKLALILLSITLASGGYNRNRPRPFSPLPRPTANRPLPEPSRPNSNFDGSYGNVRWPPQQPMVTKPPQQCALDVDESRVREFASRWCKLFNNGDIDSLMDLYAEDIMFLQYGREFNKRELRQDIEEIMRVDTEPCREVVDVVSGNYLYPYYTGRILSSKSSGISGVFSDVLRLRDDGEYEIVLVTVSFVSSNENVFLRLDSQGSLSDQKFLSSQSQNNIQSNNQLSPDSQQDLLANQQSDTQSQAQNGSPDSLRLQSQSQYGSS